MQNHNVTRITLKRDNYTVTELIKDDSFRRWVDGRASAREEKRWNYWISSNDENRELAREASHYLIGLSFQSPDMPVIEKEWAHVLGKIKHSEHNRLPLDQRRGIRYSWIYAVAVVVLLSIVAGISFYTGLWQINSGQGKQAMVKEKTVTTGQDEQKTITLSDGSTIILKANATLTYRDGQTTSGKTAQIRLNGKAYFSIIHNNVSRRPKLQITTPQGVIYDMGTRFFISATPAQTTVVLQEGSVSVEPKNEKSIGRANRIDVTPGELVEVRSNGNVIKKHVNPTLYTSWATGALQFHYTPVIEFARRLEQMYDIKVITNPTLTTKKINGAVYYRSMEELVKSVSQVLKVPVYRSASGDTIYIGQQTKQTNTINN